MVNLDLIFFRLFLVLNLLFWTEAAMAQLDAQADDFSSENGRENTFIYGLVGLGSSSRANVDANLNIEIGRMVSNDGVLFWGPFFSHITTTVNETFSFPNTGYQETRHNQVTLNSVGLSGLRKITESFGIHTSLGISSSTLKVKSVDTDAPTPSTAVGFEDGYPLGLHFQLGLQVSKKYDKKEFVAEATYQDSALGMKHSLTSTSINLLFRYYYNQ